MNAVEKRRLTQEAKMQISALKKINIWKMIAIAFSTIGVAVTYAGIAGQNQNIFLGISGILLMILSAGCAIILNLGLKNGRRNVEKILNVLNGNSYEV